MRLGYEAFIEIKNNFLGSLMDMNISGNINKNFKENIEGSGFSSYCHYFFKFAHTKTNSLKVADSIERYSNTWTGAPSYHSDNCTATP